MKHKKTIKLNRVTNKFISVFLSLCMIWSLFSGTITTYADNEYGIMPIGEVSDDSVDEKYFSFSVWGANEGTQVGDYADFDALKNNTNSLENPDFSINVTSESWTGPMGGDVVVNSDGDNSEAVQEILASYPQIEGYKISSIRVNDTIIHHLGMYEVIGKEYVHFTSVDIKGIMSTVVLPQNYSGATPFEVRYVPEEYKVNYEVYVDGNKKDDDDPQFGLDAVFGQRRVSETVDKWFGTDVTIPAGYTARVYIGNTEDFSTQQYINDQKYPDEEGYGNYALGQDVIYTSQDRNITIDPEQGPGFFSLTGTYLSGDKDSATADQTVRVEVTKRDETTVVFNPNHWMNSTEVDRTESLGENVARASSNGEPTRTANEDGTYDLTWSFTTTNQFTGNVHFELRSLSINGQSMAIPYIDAVTTEAETAETVLPSGARVEIGVTATQGNGGIVRSYTITIRGMLRRAVITGGSLNNDADSYHEVVIEKLFGVDLQMWKSANSNDTGYAWRDVNEATSLRADAQGQNAADFQYTNNNHDDGNEDQPVGNIRFKLQEGYEWSNNDVYDGGITFEEKTGEGSQTFSADGTVISGPDDDGWYYTTLNSVGSVGVLSIQSTSMQYVVAYQNGNTDSYELNKENITNISNSEITNMPEFDNGELRFRSNNVDANHGNYYSIGSPTGNYGGNDTNNSIVIYGNSPSSTNERPPVFKGWVVTNRNGNALKYTDGSFEGPNVTTINPEEYYILQPGDEVNLRVINDVSSLYDGENRNYAIYLTALWNAAAEPYSYYVTLNYTDADGDAHQRVQGRDLEAQHFSQEEVDADADGANEGYTTQQYYIAKRETYFKLGEEEGLPVVVDPYADNLLNFFDSTIGHWYTYDQTKNGSDSHEGEFYWDEVKNGGEVDVWLIAAYGTLRINKTVTNTEQAPGSEDQEFAFDIEISNLEDNLNTFENEENFFGENENYSVSYTVSGEEDAKTLNLSYDEVSGTYKGTINLKHNQTASLDLPAGVHYKVTEQPLEGYTSALRGNSTESGIINAADNSVVNYDNTAVPGITASKSVTNAGTGENGAFKAGETAEFDIEVTNSGKTTQNNVTVTEQLEGAKIVEGDGYTINGEGQAVIDEMAPGAVVTVKATYTVTHDDVNSDEELKNIALVKGDNGDEPDPTPEITIPKDEKEPVLEVSKTVVNADGTEPDDSQEFEFKVTLTPNDGSSLDESYPYVIHSTDSDDESGDLELTDNGDSKTGTFNLKNGQTIEIKYLPDNTEYAVTETPIAGYATVAVGDTGTLENKKTSTVSFTNTLLNKRNLTISKTVSGESGDKNKDWTFDIVLTPPEGVILAEEYSYTGIITADGVDKPEDNNLLMTANGEDGTYTARITLKHGQGIIINGLPNGTQYKVTEQGANSDGYQTTILSPDATPNDGVAEGTLSFDARADYNNQNPVGTGNLIIEKIVEGESGETDKEFTFTVSLKDGEGSPISDGYSYSGSKEGTIKDGGEIKLKNGERVVITNLPLNTQYEVNEVEANKNGYVTTSVGASGQFDDVNQQKTAIFTNSRGTGALTISKSLNESGSTPPDMERQFNFRITLDLPDDITDESVEYSYTDNSQASQSGSLTFNKDAGTGYYTADTLLKIGQSITINDLIDGTKYSVAETEVPAGYTPDVKYTPAESANWGGPISSEAEEFKADIVNTYNEKSAKFIPQVNKTVTGTTPHNEMFTFNIEEGEGNPENGAEFTSNTATVTGSGSTNFGAITFTKEGTYTFKITEANGGVHGYTYDGSEWTLTVVVVDNDSQLEVQSYNYSKADGMTSNDGAAFTNTYNVNSTEFTPKVNKTVKGDTPRDKTFTFNITASEENPENGAILPEDKTATVTGSGTASFGNITFSKAGTYNFEIKETKGNDSGYTYDESVWTLTVKVVDNESQLEVQSYNYSKADGTTSNDGAAFTNTYNVSPTEFTPKVNKTVKGDTPSDKTFTFNITASEDNPNGAELPTDISATVNGAGSTNFGNIKFTKAGTYNFEIKETKGNDAGYAYDESIWTLSVVVVDNDSKLEVESHSYTKADGTTSNDGAEFTNTYSVEPTEFTPKVNKTVKGDTPSDKTFTFNITASENNPSGLEMPTDTSATVTGSGTASFDNITFSKAGTYNFEIKEEQGNEPGYSYDGNVWTLTVEVIDDNSQLKVSKAEYTKDGEQSSDEASFENNYSTTEVSYAPQVTKEITGDKTSSDKTFTFNIEASEDNPSGAEMPEDKTATVKGAGSANFNAITFTKAGTYTFKISETKGNDAGYTYDESVYTLKVVVEDVDSALTIKSLTYEKEGGTSSEERALFTNTYSVEPTEYVPQIEKTVTGNTPSDEDFTFNIKASEDNPDGAEMPTDTSATVTGSGTASFDKITLTKAGTYTFEISEEKGNVFGYTYDESVWTLTVVVVDNESKLEVQSHTYTKTDGTANEDKAEFENIYNSGSLTISKVVTGNAGDKNKEFTFTVTLTDANGNPLDGEYSYTGSKEGTIKSGGEIKLKDGESVTISGLPIGTKYTVAEAEANKDGYTTTSKGESGEISEKEQKAEFTNSKNTEPTKPTDPTNPTNPTNPTDPTSQTEPKKTTTTKRTPSNPPYSKTNITSQNNNAKGNSANTPNTGSESERNLPIAFLVTFLLGLNTVYFSFRRRKLKGRKVK